MDSKEEVAGRVGSCVVQGGSCGGQYVSEGRVGSVGLAIGACGTSEWVGCAWGLCGICEVSTSGGEEMREVVGSRKLGAMLGAGGVSMVVTVGTVVAWVGGEVTFSGSEMGASTDGSVDRAEEGGGRSV